METLIIALVAAGRRPCLRIMAWRWSSALAEVASGLEALAAGIKARPVLTAARGPVGRLVRTFNAAAAEVQAQTARLDQDRQQLLVVLEAMAEAVIAVDLRRRLLFANASANRLFGLDATSVGRLVPELIRSPQVQEAVEATLRLAGPDAYQAELTLPGRDRPARGHNRFLSVRGTPLPGRPSPGAVLGLPRRHRAAPARADAARLRRQRLPRAQDAAGLDQGLYRDPARLGPPRRDRQRPVPRADRRAGRAAQPVDSRPAQPGPNRVAARRSSTTARSSWSRCSSRASRRTAAAPRPRT